MLLTTKRQLSVSLSFLERYMKTYSKTTKFVKSRKLKAMLHWSLCSNVKYTQTSGWRRLQNRVSRFVLIDVYHRIVYSKQHTPPSKFYVVVLLNVFRNCPECFITYTIGSLFVGVFVQAFVDAPNNFIRAIEGLRERNTIYEVHMSMTKCF